MDNQNKKNMLFLGLPINVLIYLDLDRGLVNVKNVNIGHAPVPGQGIRRRRSGHGVNIVHGVVDPEADQYLGRDDPDHDRSKGSPDLDRSKELIPTIVLKWFHNQVHIQRYVFDNPEQ